MSKCVLIRADASFEIGFGHISRCLVLADLFNKNGYKVIFVCSNVLGNPQQQLEEKNFICHLIEVQSDSKLDAQRCLKLANDLNYDLSWIIFDHYYIDPNWLDFFESKIKKFVIDDLLNKNWNCDFLLNSNVAENSNDYNSKVNEGCKLLLGPKYILIDEKFFLAPKVQLNNIKKSIFVNFGAADNNNMTLRILTSLERLSCAFNIIIVTGNLYRHTEILKNYIKNSELKITWHQNINNMEVILQDVEIAIGAIGNSLFERAVLGIPSLVVSTNKFQIPIAKKLHDEHYCIYLGDHLNLSDDELTSGLEIVLKNTNEIVKVREKVLSVYSNGWCKKISDEIFK